MPTLVRRATEAGVPTDRRERLAVNVVDLTRIDPMIRGMLVSDKLDLTESIRTDPERIDEAAVKFSCDLLTAACVCDTLRSHDKRSGDYPTRVYLRKGLSWIKLPGQAVLTKVIGTRLILNPELFPPDVAPADLLAPPIQSVTM